MRASHRSRAKGCLSLLLALPAACGRKEGPTADARGRDLQLAPPSAAQPALRDLPAASGSAIAPGGARAGSAGGATVLMVHAVTSICTNTHHVGDRVSARLTEAAPASNGVLIPAGSSVSLRVVESMRSENSKDHARLSLAPVSLTVEGMVYALDGRVTRLPALRLRRVQSTQAQGGKVAAGAAIGAIAGQLLGKNTRSTVIGAAVGAAGGGAVAAAQADYDACVPSSEAILITLDGGLAVKALARAP
ncbi:MAG: hypothetical protein ACHQQ3_08465 [Gemmatimonadales bacterium]